MGRLGQKHAVAIAEKAVFLLDGVAIGGEDWFVSREGRDEHEQAGLGQVEVGEQGVDEAELEAGGDEDFRFAGMGLERTAGGLKRAVFQRADDRSADGDDAAAFGGSAVDGVGG